MQSRGRNQMDLWKNGLHHRRLALEDILHPRFKKNYIDRNGEHEYRLLLVEFTESINNYVRALRHSGCDLGSSLREVVRVGADNLVYGVKVHDEDPSNEFICQADHWLPKGSFNLNALAPTEEPFLPRIVNGEIFEFFDEQVHEVPAILEVGDRGFIFAKVSDVECKRTFVLDGRFIIPSDWTKHEFFLQLLTFLVSGHDASAKEAFGLYFKASDTRDDFFVFMCKTNGVFQEIGTFPKNYLEPMVGFLEKCFSAPLFDFDYNTMSLKPERF